MKSKSVCAYNDVFNGVGVATQKGTANYASIVKKVRFGARGAEPTLFCHPISFAFLADSRSIKRVMSYLPEHRNNEFVPLPQSAEISLTWPTDNRALLNDPLSYFARTRVNADYGRPGMTRDCGKRIHYGCDIAPADKTPDGKTHTVMFSNCETGEEYPSDEPGWIPHDQIYAVFKGVVVEISTNADTHFGHYIIIEHHWHNRGASFYSLYAHLNKINVKVGDILKAGQAIGTMGTTSVSEDAKKWMAIAPHLHLEFWNDAGENYNPEEFLFAFIERS